MKLVRLVVATLLSVAACGDDGGKVPDARMPDARECGAVNAGVFDILDYDPDGFIVWAAPIMGTLADGTPMYYQFEFYDGIEPTLSGTFDLASGNQSNYATCAICVRAFAVANNMVTKRYFHSGGTITLSEDPFTNNQIKATVTGLTFEEVTIASQTFVSTPIPGGQCAAVADTTIDKDRVPNAWTCPHPDWDTGTNCNCVCGLSDPDCASDAAPVMGCATVGDVCFQDACVAPPANNTCATAVALTLGTPLAGTTAGAGRNYDVGLEEMTCTGFEQPGPDVVYSVDLTMGVAYTVTLSGLQATFDGSVALVGPATDAAVCDTSPINCVAGSDEELDGDNETFMFTPTATGTYYVIVDSFSATEGGTFTINVAGP